MDSGYFKQQIIDLHSKLADARIDRDEARIAFLERQVRLAVATYQSMTGGPLDAPPPFSDLKLTTDLASDDPCILGRHRPTPPTA